MHYDSEHEDSENDEENKVSDYCIESDSDSDSEVEAAQRRETAHLRVPPQWQYLALSSSSSLSFEIINK